MTDDPFLAPPSQPAAVPAPQQPAMQPATQPPPPPPPPAPTHYQPQQGYPQQGYTQPGYTQQGYPASIPPPMPYYGVGSKPKTWMNWAALGCGLGALLTCVSFIPAIVFGHLGLAAAKRGEADKRGAGLAGLIIGYVYAAGFIAYIAIFFIFGVFGNSNY